MSDWKIIAPPTLIGFDAAQDVTHILPAAVAAGVGWIGRYYSFNAHKNLTNAEATAILNAGFDIVTVWEAAGDRFDTFNEVEGRREATAALAQAKECGQPSNTCIYFAVDFDANHAQIDTGIKRYFTGVNAVLAGHYKVGVYGSGLVCAQLDAAGLVSYDWLAAAMGWQGSRAYSNAHLTEIEQDVDPWDIGINVDRDMAPAGRDFGSWRGGITPPVPIPIPPPPAPQVDIHALIVMIQQALNAQAGANLSVDGIFGPRTYAALQNWQNRRS